MLEVSVDRSWNNFSRLLDPFSKLRILGRRLHNWTYPGNYISSERLEGDRHAHDESMTWTWPFAATTTEYPSCRKSFVNGAYVRIVSFQHFVCFVCFKRISSEKVRDYISNEYCYSVLILTILLVIYVCYRKYHRWCGGKHRILLYLQIRRKLHRLSSCRKCFFSTTTTTSIEIQAQVSFTLHS